MLDTREIKQLARMVIDTEAQAILGLRDRIDDNFVKICELLLACRGRIIITGIGKAGHIGNKIAATLSSTGSPAFFVHPSEARHGDIGAITKNDVVIAISNSGNTEEILAILPFIRLLGVPLIGITGNLTSILAKTADINLDIKVEKEACPLGLAPTSSTAAILAMGDALAMVLLKLRGFTIEDFAHSHPGGILGKRLLLKVDDLMRTGNAIPRVTQDTLLIETIIEITNKRMGMTLVTDNNNVLVGIFTDGDLRRVIDKNLDIRDTKICDVMTKNYKTIIQGILIMEAIKTMEMYQITTLIVIDSNNFPVGVIHIHDLLKSGLM
ncbi:MAG: KpsF/GutQ family sugar-phosphate isomerase [Coxiellaceae bacterium]|jgi:arabinose-5-phosphate isomerase|nr:KpsF/GutQ family sugar-phosphate isomerase [Coxiellaceae bacterium]